MRVLVGEQVLARIYIRESDQWQDRPLAHALLELLRREGFAGATVLHGIAGFGAHSFVDTTPLWRPSIDLPVVIEVVDNREHMERLAAIVDEMVPEGLVTMETVRVVKHGARALPR